MVRVPISFWGVAVGLLTASVAVGQTSEPSGGLPLIRQCTAELQNPVLALMVEGDLTAFENSPAQEPPRLAPTPQSKDTPAKTNQASPNASASSEACPFEVECPMLPCYLPYAYPQQQQGCAHKSHHRRQRGSCGAGQNGCYGNQYGYGMDGCSTCYAGAPYASQGCNCRKCQRARNSGHHASGSSGYGCSYCGGNGAMGYQGYGYEGCACGYGEPFVAPAPPASCLGKSRHKHGYASSGYPGWPCYPVPGANMVGDGFNSFTDPNCYKCSKHHGLFGHCRQGHCGHQHAPRWPASAYPMIPCMEMGDFCADCSSGTSGY